MGFLRLCFARIKIKQFNNRNIFLWKKALFSLLGIEQIVVYIILLFLYIFYANKKIRVFLIKVYHMMIGYSMFIKNF